MTRPFLHSISVLLFTLTLSLAGCSEDVTGAPPENKAAFDKQRQDALATTSAPKFEAFRVLCSTYHASLEKARTLEELMHRREATQAQIEEWTRLSETLQTQRSELLATMSQEQFSTKDREAMRWIMGSGN